MAKEKKDTREHTQRHTRFFFSVLRLCGSRQVVAHCCADERINQMQFLCPSLGSRKWSADRYAVRGLVRPKKQTNQSNTTKTRNTRTSRRSTDQTARNIQAATVPMNSRSCTETNEKHQTTVQDLAKVSSKTNHSAAPKPRIPRQDPGDHAEKPSRHKTSSHMQPCNELESKHR